MAFVLTMMFIALSLASPGALPDFMVYLHLNLVLGVLASLALLSDVNEVGFSVIKQPVFGVGLIPAVALSVLFSTWPGHIFVMLGLFVPILFTYFFVALSCKTMSQLKITAAVLALTGMFVMAHGLLAIRNNDVLSPYLLVENHVLLRIQGIGVIADPNDLAQVLIISIPLLWLRWQKGKFFTNTLFTLIPALILAAGVYFTHSRGGTVGLLAIVFFGFKDKLGTVKSGILAGIATVGLLASGISGGRGMNQDDGNRLSLWHRGLELVREHPVFGVGMGNYGMFTDHGLTAHNSFILCMAELGSIGYFLWLGIIVLSWMSLGRIMRMSKVAPPVDEAEPVNQLSFHASHPARNPWLAMSQSNQPLMATGGSGLVMPNMPAYDRPEKKLVSPPRMAAWQQSINETEAVSASDLAHAARVVRVAAVGLLVTSFFLSRAFSISFYIVFGLAAAVEIMYWRAHPDYVQSTKWLYARVISIMIGTVVGLYLFMRFHGLH